MDRGQGTLRESTRDRSGNGIGYGVVRIFLGLLLVVAGGLKAHQLATEPVVTNGIEWMRAVLILEMEVEIAFGFWLIGGLLPRTTWLAALGCFTVFCGVTLYKGIGGQASCGCFGRISVSPWYTLTLDVIAVAALLWRRPAGGNTGGSAGRWRVRLGIVAGLVLACGVGAGVAAGMYEPARLSEDGQIIGDGRVVLLEPDQNVKGVRTILSLFMIRIYSVLWVCFCSVMGIYARKSHVKHC